MASKSRRRKKAEAKCNLLAESRINGRNVWLYEIESPIGNIYVVDWEKETKEIVRVLFDEKKHLAEKLYTLNIQKIADGRL